ncbi:PAQR family membrane homeostasis protein TrhA [Lactococcus insecticola]|uniref:Hemolysin III n=1 Tax=Pseudolactococcus insecticola TaxID=2709158 RepID=A0A6A0B6I3_9LACT|nr:hemolysin III family protein [Lactococcus insecticola]GFH40111.1 hemolysin III [Lactococcus insecticola]
MKNSKAYLITNEVFNAVTHGIGFGLAVWGLVLLLFKGIANHSAIQVTSYAIYGTTLILLFLFSTLFHSLIFTRANQVFQVFDHSSIYLLIAGTYTPYCLITLNGWLGWTLFSIVWVCAIIGIVIKSIFLPKWDHVPKISTVLYVIMGWLIVFAMKPLWDAIPHMGVLLLFLGGVLYTCGAFFYSLKFPYAHVVWHLFVIAAAILMWFSVYKFI